MDEGSINHQVDRFSLGASQLSASPLSMGTILNKQKNHKPVIVLGLYFLLFFRCHMTDKVRTHLGAIRTDGCLIPGGLTSNLQPADVSRNKPFKSAYRELYNNWMASGENHTFLLVTFELQTNCVWSG